MLDRNTVIEALQYLISGECTDTQFDYLDEIEAAIAMLKEQEAEIRQLRLALDIAKGTCKGIVFETDEKFMGDL